MWSDKDQDTRRNVGTYNLRDVLAQAASAEGGHDAAAKPRHAGAPPTPPPVPNQKSKKSGGLRAADMAAEEPAQAGEQRDVPLLPPKGITYAATGALASVAALALTHMLASSKPPGATAKFIPSVVVTAVPLPTGDIGSGALVSTLSSLSKTVLAGYSHLPPPTASEGAEAPQAATPLALSDVIRVRASNVVTGNGGLDSSWPIEILTPGIGLPNAKILIEGLPASARLNHGWLKTDGRWTLSLADLPGLTVTVPAAFARAAVTVSLVNEHDVTIAHADAIVEPVPQPEVAPLAARAEVTLQEKFTAFLEKWKHYNGRDHLTEAERAALFVEYRAIVQSADAKAH